MYNRFSVDLASELRPSDCIDLYVVIATPLKSTKHYLPIYKYYLHLKVILQATLRLLLLSVPLFFFSLHQALTHRARVASGKSDAVFVCFFSFFFFKV